MSVSAYQLAGNRVRFRMAFADDAGTLMDPNTVTCVVGLEGEDGESLDVVRDSLGTYHADWDTTGKAGTYWARTNGTGAIIGADEIPIKIRASKLAN